MNDLWELMKGTFRKKQNDLYCRITKNLLKSNIFQIKLILRTLKDSSQVIAFSLIIFLFL